MKFTDRFKSLRSGRPAMVTVRNNQNAIQQSRARHTGLGRLPRWFFIVCCALIIHMAAFSAHATPTQEDVFKSISSNVNDKIDGQKVLGFFAAVTGAIIMLVLINRRQQREDAPKVTNHQGKLLRELMKTTGLKASQIRQLKALSADLAEKGEPVKNLATLLLCPSLIKKAREPRLRK